MSINDQVDQALRLLGKVDDKRFARDVFLAIKFVLPFKDKDLGGVSTKAQKVAVSKVAAALRRLEVALKNEDLPNLYIAFSLDLDVTDVERLALAQNCRGGRQKAADTRWQLARSGPCKIFSRRASVAGAKTGGP